MAEDKPSTIVNAWNEGALEPIVSNDGDVTGYCKISRTLC